MSQKWSEAKLPDFYPSSVYGFKQIMSCKINKQGWVYVKRIHEKMTNSNFELKQIGNKKQEITSNQLISTLLNKEKLLYPNQISIYFDLEFSVSDKPFNKNIGYLELKNNSSVYEEFQSSPFLSNIPNEFLNMSNDQKYLIFKIPNFGSLLRLSQNKQWNIIIKTYKWNVLMLLNNFYFFTSRSIEQLFPASKNDEQKRKQLQDFKKISSLPFQCLIQFNSSNNLQNLNQQNKYITLKQKTKNKTNYFFQVKLVCEDLMSKAIIIGCTSKCYFYCQDQLLIQTNFQNNSQEELKKRKRKFKCIQRSTIKDDCLKQGDVVIKFQKLQKLTEDQTFRESSWIIESITKKVKEKENKQYISTKYQYFQPSLQKGQAIKIKQLDSKKYNLSQKQENLNKGAFFFNGFMLRVDYPLKIKIDKMFPAQLLQKYIKNESKDSDRLFVIKFNIFLTLGDLLAQLKYKYKFGDINLNNKYKFTINKQYQESMISHDQTFVKSQPIQLSTKDVLYQYYRKIHIEKGEIVNIQIQLIQPNQKLNNTQSFNVILAENNLVKVKGKMLGVPVKELKQNDICLIYDQKKDDTQLNTIIKIQKVLKKPKKIFKYNLTGPKNQTNFTASENITFSVGNDLYTNAVQQTLVCDLFSRASYSQNRFKAIKQQVKIKQQEQYYKIYFQKSDFILFQFPVRIINQVQNKEINLQIIFIQTKNENQVKFEIVMYNTERMTQSFKHLIQPEFYRWKTIKNINNQLSRQFCLIINHNIYSMYSNLKYVLEKDVSLKQENRIEVFLTEVPKAYFHRLLYEWKQQQKQRTLKNKQLPQNMLQNNSSNIQKKVQLPKAQTIINAIQKFNDPVDINTINNEFLMNILCHINPQNSKQNNQNSTNSQIQSKQYVQSYYCISSQLIKKQWFKKQNVFFFREIIQVKKEKCKQQDSFVLSFLTKKLLTLDKTNSKMDQIEKQKYYIPPYTYFFVQNLSQNKVYLKEVPCDISFKKKVIIWVDYNFGKKKDQNLTLIKMIKQNPFLDFILMINYFQAIRWIKIFGPVFNKLNIKILLISNLFKNMKNQMENQQNKEKIVQQKGGLSLINQFKKLKEKYENIEKPILYCGDLEKARKLREDFKLTDKDCTITNDLLTMKCQLSLNVLVVCDKFRGSLQSKQVNSVIVNTLENQFDEKMKIQAVQIADGGQGSLIVIKNHVKDGKQVQIEVTGPMLKSLVKATYYIQNHTAYIQMAQASGLKKLERQQNRNPYLTTTKGVGQLIVHAIKNKAKKIYVFVGGSATNQGGIGMASALGYKFYDNKNKQLLPIGSQLKNIHTIRQPHESTIQKLKKIQFKVFTDVNNQFYGPNGATRVYGPQKGAKTESMILDLDEGLKNLNNKLIQCGIGPKIDLQLIPGSGAAGGLAGGCIAFLGAKIQKGTDYIMKLTNIDQRINNADILITGEGKLDQSTLSGKAVSGIIQKAEEFDKQCLVLCGICKFTEIQKLNFYKLHPKTKIIQLAQNEQDVKKSMKKQQAKKRIQLKIRKHFSKTFKNYLQLP